MQDMVVKATANLAEAGRLRETVLSLGPRLAREGVSVTDERLQAWGLAVYEAATNVVRHAGSETMTLSVQAANGEVVFRLTDGGEAHSSWDALVPPPPMAEGGYGLWIIRALMHDVRYHRAPEGNVLEMVACRPTCEACRLRSHGSDLPV